MSADIQEILREIGLSDLFNNFESEKITSLETVTCLQDTDLERLGLVTIGDRVRFKEASRSRRRSGPSTPNDTGRSTLDATTSSTALSLFRPSRTRFPTTSKQKKVTGRPWTGNFMCLAQNDAICVPSSSQKEVLQNAGLGYRKIVLCSTSSEEDVKTKLLSEDGFPALRTGGGFELLKCASNCRRLEIVKGALDANNLKMLFGSQCKVYVRPIQHCLSLQPVNVASSTAIMEECQLCKQKFLLSELRQHVNSCPSKTEELPDLNNAESSTVVTNNPQIDADDVDLSTTIDNELLVNSMYANSTPVLENEVISADQPVITMSNDDELYDDIVKYCKQNNIDEPIEILRIMQQKIVMGRPLELENEESIIEGDTNYIIVSRDNILEEGLEEVRGIRNPKICLEVQFTGEAAVDYGGPRKEFFRLMLQNIQERYFQCFPGLSLLQNGNLPRVMDADLVEELFLAEDPRPFLKDIRRGLDSLGIFKIAKQLPIIMHLFTPEKVRPITYKMVTHLLNAVFSETGSNRKIEENRLYRKFLKYLKEVASGRRGDMTLGKVLMFVTGTDVEPPLGFRIHPALHFVDSESPLPTANTCINKLWLSLSGSNTPEAKLFDLYDLGFSNAFYGLQ